MSTQDQSFYNIVMLVIGTLVGVAVILIFLARYFPGGSQLEWTKEDPEYAAQVAARIKPAGQVALPGNEPAAEPIATPAAGPVAAKLTGEQVYNAACVACHGQGIGGAPKFGDHGAWAPRIAQGKDILRKRALEGYQGKTGVMPPKGGRVDLSDEEISNAVDFMVGKAG